MKSTVDEIRKRFDRDVDRFSNLETGQSATIDAPLCMDLVVASAVAVTPHAKAILDIGCGAGNYTLKLLAPFVDADATLIDLSQPMLERAAQRVRDATSGQVRTQQGDIRELDLGAQQYDVAVAAAVLHHLRSEDEWRTVCAKVFQTLKPGGSFWIVDLVSHTNAGIEAAMWQRYGDYLCERDGEAYRDHVLGYIEKEDSPVPVMTIVDHLRSAGFVNAEVLHKNSCFAAIGAVVPDAGKET